MLRKSLLIVIALFLFSSTSFAGSTYLYKGRTNYVRLEKARKHVRKMDLNHPYTFTDDKIRSILEAYRYNKQVALMQDVFNQRVFDDRAVEFLTPYIVEGFKRLGKKQSIHFVYVHKRKSTIRHHYLIAGRTYVVGDKLHIRFNKLHAKLMGDYQRSGAESLLASSKSLGVTLKYVPGISPSDRDVKETIVNISHDFTKSGEPSSQIVNKTKIESNSVPVEEKKTVRQRLKDLKKLKDEELITEKEYNRKRQELISEL